MSCCVWNFRVNSSACRNVGQPCGWERGRSTSCLRKTVHHSSRISLDWWSINCSPWSSTNPGRKPLSVGPAAKGPMATRPEAEPQGAGTLEQGVSASVQVQKTTTLQLQAVLQQQEWAQVLTTPCVSRFTPLHDTGPRVKHLAPRNPSSSWQSFFLYPCSWNLFR